MTRYMLDTNTCIYLIKHHPKTLYDKMSVLPLESIAVSSIVIAELWYGVSQSQKKKQNEAALKDFLEYVVAFDWPHGAGPIYGSIRRHLKEKGTPIGAMDLLIAAHALFLGSILVTNNTKKFERVPDLNFENWIER